MQKKSGVPGPRTPDSRFPEKIWSTGARDSRLQISRKIFWSTGAPDSRLQISRKNLEYRGPGLQTPDFRKKSGVPGPRTPDSRFPEKNLEYLGPQTPDSRFPEKIWSTGAPDSRLQISRKNWSTRSPRLQTPDFQKKSGVPAAPDSRLQTPDYRLQNLESRVAVLQIFSGNLESGVRGAGTPDFFWKSGVWSLGVLQIFSGNLESGVGGYSRFFLEIWSLESPPSQNPLPRPIVWIMGGGGEHIYIYIYFFFFGGGSTILLRAFPKVENIPPYKGNIGITIVGLIRWLEVGL